MDEIDEDSFMEFGIFSTRIKDKIIQLKTAREIVRYSSLIRNSISYLDLEVNQRLPSSHCFGPLWDRREMNCAGHFINTDEKFRKFYSPRSRLLYTLHLDLPRGRVYSLKDTPDNLRYECDDRSIHISKIVIALGYELKLINDFIADALNVNFPKLKLLKWILKIHPHPHYFPLLYLLESKIANQFIGCFYPVVTDAALFKDFILQFDIKRFMTTHEYPAILQSMLYHARLYGRTDLDEEFGLIDEAVGHCLFEHFYVNVGVVLNFIDSPEFTDFYYLFQLEISRTRPLLEILYGAEIWIKQERIDHMMLIIFMYLDSSLHGCTEAASEALRLIWSSISDPCITREELKMVFEAVFSEEELNNVYDFYVSAVKEFHEYKEPRSLLRLCRTVLRRRIRQNKFWIPEGVSRTGLPKSLQSFLNLK